MDILPAAAGNTVDAPPVRERVCARPGGDAETAILQGIPELVRCIAVGKQVHRVQRSQRSRDNALLRAKIGVEDVSRGPPDRMHVCDQPPLVSGLHRGHRVQREVVGRIAADDACIGRRHKPLDVQETHVAERIAVAVLLAPVQKVALCGEVAYGTGEELLVVHERARGVGDDHVRRVQIHGLEPDEGLRRPLVVASEVVGVEVVLARVPAPLVPVCPALQLDRDIRGPSGLDVHALAAEPVLVPSDDGKLQGSGRDVELRFAHHDEECVAPTGNINRLEGVVEDRLAAGSISLAVRGLDIESCSRRLPELVQHLHAHPARLVAESESVDHDVLGVAATGRHREQVDIAEDV